MGGIWGEVKAHGAKGHVRQFRQHKLAVEKEHAGGNALKQQKHLGILRDRLMGAGLIPAAGAAPKPDNKTQELKDRGFKTAGAKRIAQADRDAAAGKKPTPDLAPREINKEPNKKGRTSGEAERSAAKKAPPRRDISLDREEHAKALMSMGVSSPRAKELAHGAHPSESKTNVQTEKSKKKESEFKADVLNILKGKETVPKEKGTLTRALSDVERLMRGEKPIHVDANSGRDGSLTKVAKEMGVGTKTAKAIAKSERDKLQPQKGQITKLESALGLGTQTRKEVGRDRSALIEEAKNLKANKLSEMDKLEKLENKLKREQAKPEQIQVVKAKGEKLWNEILEIDRAIKGPATKATGNTKWARDDAKDFDFDITKNKLKREGDSKYDKWEDSYGSGAKQLGAGAYGTAIRNKDGTVIKRGDIGSEEAAVMKKLEGKDLVPKLIAADINGAGINSHHAFDIRRGRIAMGLVPGEPVGDKAPWEKIGGTRVADAYWKARADLHRNGVAHNDMHIENVLIDGKGKGRFVDMGMAQASPKAALAEALGAFQGANVGKPGMPPVGSSGRGDWQLVRWKGTGGKLLEETEWKKGEDRAAAIKALKGQAPLAAKVLTNKRQALDELRKIGLNNDEIASIMDHGIRNRMTTYDEGPWAKLSNAQAQHVIDTLYEGI